MKHFKLIMQVHKHAKYIYVHIVKTHQARRQSIMNRWELSDLIKVSTVLYSNRTCHTLFLISQRGPYSK